MVRTPVNASSIKSLRKIQAATELAEIKLPAQFSPKLFMHIAEDIRSVLGGISKQILTFSNSILRFKDYPWFLYVQ